jgi:nucleoside-diphosphate-sugar epimerase
VCQLVRPTPSGGAVEFSWDLPTNVLSDRPRQRARQQALNNEPLTVFGDGSQSRSFCYVSDLIEGILRLAMSEYHSPVNIGNPVEMTIKQFAQKILEITGATGGIIYTDLPVDDPKVHRPDIARARALLGWQPKVDFDKGIRLTIDYFQSSRSQRYSSRTRRLPLE